MNIHTVRAFLKGGRLPALVQVIGLSTAFYRVSFLSAGAEHGLFSMLAERPRSLAELATAMSVPPEGLDALRSWLGVGVRLGEISLQGSKYALHSRLARHLGSAEGRAVAAALQELSRFHHDALQLAPKYARTGQRFKLSDQDGELIAESTRVIQPLVEEAVDRALQKGLPSRVLEVGCGTGIYVRRVLEAAPQAHVTALELQSDVAALARRNLAEWGLAARSEVLTGDVRDLDQPGQYDLVTLHNNIYYFPVPERVILLQQVRRLLRPGGRLLLTTSCTGGNLGVEVLSLWFTASECGGRLPEPAELVASLRSAGYADPEAVRIVPGDAFYAFYATQPNHSARPT